MYRFKPEFMQLILHKGKKAFIIRYYGGYFLISNFLSQIIMWEN